MPENPNPTESRVAYTPSQVEREVMCAGYHRCLDETIRRKWLGFSCRQCQAFRPLQLDLSEWIADSLACLALMYVAESQTRFKQKPRGGIVLKLRRLRSRDDMLIQV